MCRPPAWRTAPVTLGQRAHSGNPVAQALIAVLLHSERNGEPVAHTANDAAPVSEGAFRRCRGASPVLSV